ncbi:MAG: valine--tRNA ligase, partial [Oscillospiraceae bacterium]|nr:valine--tRNA ligase [Oscillospiraceae bacterium]
AEMNVPPSKKPHLIIVSDKAEVFRSGSVYLSRLAYAGSVEIVDTAPADTDKMVGVITNEAKLFMPLAELVDISKEIARIEKELEKAQKLLAGTNAKLANEKFTSKAPEQVVNAEREKAAKAQALIDNLNEALAALK